MSDASALVSKAMLETPYSMIFIPGAELSKRAIPPALVSSKKPVPSDVSMSIPLALASPKYCPSVLVAKIPAPMVISPLVESTEEFGTPPKAPALLY
jgi:hypothetical protein